MADLIKNINLTQEVVIPPRQIPSPLEDFSASQDTANTMLLGWTDPGALATHYDIQHDTNLSFSNNLAIVTIAANPNNGSVYTKTGLVTGTLYYFRVRAKNETGNSVWIVTSGTTL